MSKKEWKKCMLPKIKNDERFIYSTEDQKPFTQKMSVEEFDKAFVGKSYIIEGCLPTSNHRKKYLKKMCYLLSLLELKEKEELDEAIKKIKHSHALLKDPLERQIKKLDSLIFLEEEFELITIDKPDVEDESLREE